MMRFNSRNTIRMIFGAIHKIRQIIIIGGDGGSWAQIIEGWGKA